MKTMPSFSHIAVSLAGAVVFATFAFGDIAPYPHSPSIARKWFKPDNNPPPTFTDNTSEVQALAKTISEAGMLQLQEALLQIAPGADNAIRAYMQALYKDRMEKQESGQITPQEARQLAELQQMMDNGSLPASDSP